MAADRGFTLVEVLVAFVIAAVALGALFEGTAGSLSNTGAAGRYDEALSRARSHLAAVGHGLALGVTRQQGEEGHGFHWAVAIEPLGSLAPRAPDPATKAASPGLALYAVEVVESWQDDGGSRRVHLVTRRLGPALP